MNTTKTEIIARAVIRRQNQLLLARMFGNSWSFLPGGHVEPGERVEAALVRELAEELGAESEILGFVGAVEHGYVENGVIRHEINLVFDVAITDNEPVSQEAHLEFHWLPLDRLARCDVRPRTLITALLNPGADRVPFWRGWTG